MLGTLAGAALLAAVPSAASAGVLVQSAPSCDNGATSQPFSQFGDDNDYFLAPAGSFEDGARLEPERRAGRERPGAVAGGRRRRDACAQHPGRALSRLSDDMRRHRAPHDALLRHRSGLLAATSQLLVTARVETSLGLVLEVPVGTLTTLTNGTKWNKTPTQIVLASLLPLLPGEHTPIQFRFTAVGTSDWVIDDVFVDPRYRA